VLEGVDGDEDALFRVFCLRFDDFFGVLDFAVADDDEIGFGVVLDDMEESGLNESSSFGTMSGEFSSVTLVGASTALSV